MATKSTAKKAEAPTENQAEARTETVAKGLEDVTAFGQQNVEALVKVSEVAAKTAETLTGELTTYSKKSFEDMVAVAQDLATAKTATEVFEKQSVFAKTAFEGFMAQASKMNEMYMAAAKDMTAPLNERVQAASQSLKPFTA